jgi:hypothetical protein
MLGRSLTRWAAFRAAAFERAASCSGGCGLYADYADALAMSQDRRLDDKVLALVDRALKLRSARR